MVWIIYYETNTVKVFLHRGIPQTNNISSVPQMIFTFYAIDKISSMLE